VVVWTALSWGAGPGLMTGAVAGLAQDALSGGILGVGGLSKTVVGFVVGVLGSQFIMTHAFPRFLVFFGATVLQAACFLGLYAGLQSRQFGSPYTVVMINGLANGIVGLLVFRVIESLPGALERRHRTSLRNRWVE